VAWACLPACTRVPFTHRAAGGASVSPLLRVNYSARSFSFSVQRFRRHVEIILPVAAAEGTCMSTAAMWVRLRVGCAISKRTVAR
jgi:hypothetical protein